MEPVEHTWPETKPRRPKMDNIVPGINFLPAVIEAVPIAIIKQRGIAVGVAKYEEQGSQSQALVGAFRS